MNKLSIAIATGLLLGTAQVSAQDGRTGGKGLDAGEFYFGGGLSLNDVDYADSAVGFQVFAGLPLFVKTENVNLGVEVGYMDSGDFDRNAPFVGMDSAKGLWGAVVASVPLKSNIYALGRFGLDIGDDDGLLIGAGLGFVMSEGMDLRVEYVVRDNIDSIQLNAAFSL